MTDAEGAEYNVMDIKQVDLKTLENFFRDLAVYGIAKLRVADQLVFLKIKDIPPIEIDEICEGLLSQIRWSEPGEVGECRVRTGMFFPRAEKSAGLL